MIICLATLTGWQKSSNYPIDDKPAIKTDTTLLGIWKAVEDTDKSNYVIVRNYYDTHFIQDDKEHQLDKWDLNTTEYHKKKDYFYYVSYINKHGHNVRYGNFDAYFSSIAGKKFWNFYSYGNNCLIIIFIDRNNAGDSITIAAVSNKALSKAGSAADVRQMIANNINNPDWYADTLHLYKVSGYHGSPYNAGPYANPR